MGVMNSLCALAVLSLSSSALGAPRELDHIDHFHQRESFGRGLLRVALPVPLALTQTRAPEPEEAQTQSDSDNEIETGAESHRYLQLCEYKNPRARIFSKNYNNNYTNVRIINILICFFLCFCILSRLKFIFK